MITFTIVFGMPSFFDNAVDESSGTRVTIANVRPEVSSAGSPVLFGYAEELGIFEFTQFVSEATPAW